MRVLLPALVRRAKEREAAERANAPPEVVVPDVPPIGTHEDPTMHMHTRVTDKLEWLNVRDRRIRRLLGGDFGVRLLLRGHRALRVQFADQLGA